MDSESPKFHQKTPSRSGSTGDLNRGAQIGFSRFYRLRWKSERFCDVFNGRTFSSRWKKSAQSLLSTLFRELFSPLSEGDFGQNLGVWKSIFWILNLHFSDRKQSRLPRFQLPHFSNAVVAEYPCLGNWLTHFPRDFLDDTWAFRSPYDGL